MTNLQIETYWKKENLHQYFPTPKTSQKRGIYDAVNGETTTPIPYDKADLVRLHHLLRTRKSFTVLEFGVGFSTLIIADALKKNQEDWQTLESPPAIRNRFQFQCFSVDTSSAWITIAENRLPDTLKPYINFHQSDVQIGTFQGQLCHYYTNLPDIVPDFIYLDGPDPQAVKGTLNGMSFSMYGKNSHVRRYINDGTHFAPPALSS